MGEIVHVHEHIKTHSTLQLTRRWTFDLDIELSQPASHWARPVNIDDGIEVITCIRCLGGERFAHGVLCSSPTPEQTFFSLRSSSERRGIDTFCRLFSTHQPTTHLRSRYRINSRSTRFVSGKASQCRWRPPKFHVDPWSRGREVARDALRSLP